MSTVVPSHVTAICPNCGKRGKTSIAHAGRTAKCAGCGERFRIPSLDDPESIHETRDERPAPLREKGPHVGFDCRICQTRLSVPVKYVGYKVKCPDCGKLTVAPPPEKESGPDIPKAIFGDQYEVYEDEQQPWAQQLIESGPRLLPIFCRHCQTLMHGEADRIGQMLTCPDCGTQTPITEPKPAPSAFDPLVEGYGVSAPEVEGGETEFTRAFFEPHERAAEEEEAAQRERPSERDRPKPPRAPMFTGVLTMLRTEGMPGRGLVLSGWNAAAGCLMQFAVPALSSMAGGKLGAFGNAMLGVCFGMLAALTGVLCFAYFAALVVSIVTETSEGNDRLYEPPSTNPTDWFGQAFTIGIGLMAAGAPGYVFGQLAGLDPVQAMGPALVSFLLAYPVVLLSQLDLDSPMGLLSGSLVAALGRAPGSWLLLVLQSIALSAAPIAAAFAIQRLSYAGVVLATPVMVFASLLYFRLIGRLAWVVAAKSLAD